MFKSVDYDKTPLQSKKFLAYMFANVTTKLYLFYCTSMKEGDLVVMTALICSLFLDVGYILGQSSLDKYVRVAAIMTGKSKDETVNAHAAVSEQQV